MNEIKKKIENREIKSKDKIVDVRKHIKNITIHSKKNSNTDEKETQNTYAVDHVSKKGKKAIKNVKEQSIKNNDLVYDAKEEKYVDSTPLKNFLDNVKNNKPAKVRYTQYYEGLLDKMRDVEFDIKAFKVKEYDTKSPELKYYNYTVIGGESITIVSNYYKLEGDGMKLFPVENNK